MDFFAVLIVLVFVVITLTILSEMFKTFMGWLMLGAVTTMLISSLTLSLLN